MTRKRSNNSYGCTRGDQGRSSPAMWADFRRTSMLRKSLLVLSFGLLCIMANPAWGQTPTTGQVSGVVKDPSGAVLVGARAALSGANGVDRETTTGGDGRYTFPLILPG